MRKIFVILLAVFLTASSMTISFAETNQQPALQAKAAVLIDSSTGEILLDKNMNRKMYPASTTKIMTALLVLENLDLSKTVTIDKETALTGGSQINLAEGEHITVEQLLYALLLKSANDAAVALAKEVSGSVPEFAALMNARAKELGARNTNFVTPNGLPDANHYTTAYDLAMIARGAMGNEKFRDIVTTLRYTIPATDKSDARELKNPNKLLYSQSKIEVNGVQRPLKYKGTTGIKNGYTSEAGRCLAASAKRGGTELISVVLNTTAEGKFADSIALLDYGFENYRNVPAVRKGEALGETKVSRGTMRNVEMIAEKTAYVTVPAKKAEASEVRTKVIKEQKIEAPVFKGQKIGTIEIYKGNILIGQVDAVAAVSVDKGGPLSFLGISDRASYVLAGCFLIIIVLLAAFIFRRRKHI
ncbi:D-alanyl-D-alanine carboxypeptidase family protein [Aminipila luticellarii]|uniref:serine-type D-Ala-D-Ala carboxypeptidase n=1 Tax=Aminipila luticellarii TaxID=2507160 RepID=A0A410PTM1_9FIRM|nr:D-alanyl-D-alanine carboxypeptidase family protein [Aminipila luticellarii]QAT42259.1 D-alanyl-D-alanine carboxypeptidase [Aminipila luticellarii]